MLSKSISHKTPSIIVLLSLFVALFVDIRPINLSIARGLMMGEGEGLMNILYPVVVFFIVLLCVINTRVKKSWSPSLIFLTIYLVMYFYISRSVFGPPETTLKMLLVFVLASFIIPSIAVVDAKTLLTGVMLFPSIAILNLDSVFATTAEWTNVVSMDVSYGFMIPIIGTIVYVFSYLREDKGKHRVFMLSLVAINTVFFFLIFLHGSRGPLLSIVLLIIFLYLIKKNPNGKGVIYSRGKMSTFILVIFIVLIGYAVFAEVIVNILSFAGIDSYALTKILELDKEGDLSNGRTELNMITLKGIIEHPLFGNGFDRFNANTNLLYPHNFILQILYDGGILFFFVLMTPIIRSTIQRYKSCAYDEYALLTFLMFSSVPGAFFSHNLYTNGLLWLFFGSVLSKQFVYNKNRTM